METRALLPALDEDMRAAVNCECKAVRTTVGIFDASTLGKIEVVGRDAAEFMNRIYVNDLRSSKLADADTVSYCGKTGSFWTTELSAASQRTGFTSQPPPAA